DEPVADPAIITAYLVNREARRSVTVLLSGVGGDELFAGYRKHAGLAMSERYRRVPRSLPENVLEPLVLSLPSMRGTPIKGHVRLAKKMARSGALSPREYYLANSTYLSDEQKAQLYDPGLKAELDGWSAYSRHLEYFDAVDEADFLNQMLYVDTKAFMV